MKIKVKAIICFMVMTICIFNTSSLVYGTDNYIHGNISNDVFTENDSFEEPTEEEKQKALDDFFNRINCSNVNSGKSITRSVFKEWYHDTGETCPRNPNYSKYNLMDIIEPGDIIYEAAGGSGLTGHIAIVEGIYTYNGRRYIRVIESIPGGVCRSVFDDERFEKQRATILTTPDYVNKQKAIEFCRKQLGKSYGIDIFHRTPSTDINTPSWYCSELVWAAYNSVGYDIEYKHDVDFLNQGLDVLINEASISPTEILLGGVSKKTTSYRLVYEKTIVEKHNESVAQLKWVPLPFTRGYEPMVAYSERIPNRFYRLNLDGYVTPNGHLESIQVNYASVQYANFNDNENFEFRCSVNNRWHNGDFPLPALNEGRKIIAKPHSFALNPTELGLKGKLLDGRHSSDGENYIWTCELSWNRRSDANQYIVFNQHHMPIAVLKENKIKADSEVRIEGYDRKVTFYVTVVTPQGASEKVPITIKTPGQII